MGRFKNRKFSLYFLTIGTVIIVLLIFASVVQLVGYFGFTRSFEREYKSSVIRTTNLCHDELGAFDPTLYLNYDQEELEKAVEELKSGKLILQYGESDDSHTTLYEGAAEDARIVSDEDELKMIENATYFHMFNESLNHICQTMGMSVVYVIVPDEDLQNYTSVFNCVNTESGYTPWELGHREKAEPDILEAYKKVYNGSNMEVVERLYNLHGAKPHITAISPVKDEKGNVKGVLCVQRYTEELTYTRRNFIQGVVAIEIIVIILIIFVESNILRGMVISPIKDISAEANRFAQDNTKSEIELTESNYKAKEINYLAHALDKMEQDTIDNIENIKQMITEKERVGADISLASKIQAGMLPKRDPILNEMSEFDVHAIMTPAKDVAGDFYDFFMIDDTHLAVEVADVSDKGFGAAFFMAISKTLIKSRAGLGGSAVDIISYVDKMIADKNEQGMFVTVWFAIIDLVTGHVDVCNAGHDYPAIKLGDNDFVIEKTVHGPPVGFIPGAKFQGYSFDMEPGDRIFLYTDGLNEAKRGDGERFGIERMLSVLNMHKEDNNERMIASMADAVRFFVGGEPQFDDITMLGFTFNKKMNK